jgi:hypothetical protein
MSHVLQSALALVVLASCSGESTGSASQSEQDGGAEVTTIADAASFTGVTPCEAGVDYGETRCLMSIDLQGGITGMFDLDNGCGTSGPLVSWSSFGRGPRISVSLGFMGTQPPVDQVGTFPLAFLDLSELQDAGALQWRAQGGCTVNIAGSICSPTTVFQNRRVINGTGSCTTPAMPGVGNTEPAVQIGDFSFLGFIDPR